MLRNDYRRALIMMRSLRTGIAGYVRLERRTLIGTMQFTVTGAREDELLYALLLYQVNGLWYAQPIGQLGPARYGQSGLVYRFDPRSIEGRALEDYTLVAVASLENGVCDLVLAGFLNGTQEVDWPQVRQAVCQSLATTSTSDRPLVDQGAPVPPIRVPDCCPARPDNGAVTLPLENNEYPVQDSADNGAVTLPLTEDSESPVTDGGTANAQDGESESAESTAAVPTFSSEPRTVNEAAESKAQSQTNTAPQSDSSEETRGGASQSADEQTQPGTEAQDSAASQPDGQAQAESSASESTDSAKNADSASPDVFDTPAQDSARPDAFDTPARLNIGESCENGCAAAELDTDSDNPWPACIEPLRMLYRTRASCRPFDAEGFVLIKAPIAPETGLDHCIAGLSCAGGKPDRVLYGIPARYTPEPPPGLEGYAWRGDTGSGYWVIVRPVC